MARAGLADGWHCLFANDCDELKGAIYRENWPGDVLFVQDVTLVGADKLDGLVDLAWASFPCQDLSQAGGRMGIGNASAKGGTRSGAVWPFLHLIRTLAQEGRHPVLLALENVVGLLNANAGLDFRALCAALDDIGYRYGAVIVDARHFVPQSRPRVFIIAIRREISVLPDLHMNAPQVPWHTQMLQRARAGLPANSAANWIWWAPGGAPESRSVELPDIIDTSGAAAWDSERDTARLIDMMASPQLKRLEHAKTAGHTMIGSLYLRMRPAAGGNVQRAEIAFCDTLGCLRTPKGGASRPRVIVVDGASVRTRLVTVQEAALLMGLDEKFSLPTTYHECFRLIGDGLVPAVVRFLAHTILEPLALHAEKVVTWPTMEKAFA